VDRVGEGKVVGHGQANDNLIKCPEFEIRIGNQGGRKADSSLTTPELHPGTENRSEPRSPRMTAFLFSELWTQDTRPCRHEMANYAKLAL